MQLHLLHEFPAGITLHDFDHLKGTEIYSVEAIRTMSKHIYRDLYDIFVIWNEKTLIFIKFYQEETEIDRILQTP